MTVGYACVCVCVWGGGGGGVEDKGGGLRTIILTVTFLLPIS